MAEGRMRGKRGGKAGKALRRTSRKRRYEAYARAGIREKNKLRRLEGYLKKAVKLGWLRDLNEDKYLKKITQGHYGYTSKVVSLSEPWTKRTEKS